MIKIHLLHTFLQESRSGEMSKSSSRWLLLRPEDSSRCRVFSWKLRGLHRRCQRGSYQTKYLMKTTPQVPYFEPKEECVEVPVEVCVQVEEQVKVVFIPTKILRSVLCQFQIILFLFDSSYFHSIHPPSFHRSQKPSFFAPGADPSVHGGGHREGAHRLHGDRHRVQDGQEGPTETK